jgi:hypothetical protein
MRADLPAKTQILAGRGLFSPVFFLRMQFREHVFQ